MTVGSLALGSRLGCIFGRKTKAAFSIRLFFPDSHNHSSLNPFRPVGGYGPTVTPRLTQPTPSVTPGVGQPDGREGRTRGRWELPVAKQGPQPSSRLTTAQTPALWVSSECVRGCGTHPEARAECKMWPLRSTCPQTFRQNPGQRWSRLGSRAGIQPSVARSEGGAHGGSDYKRRARVPLRTETKGRADPDGQ